MSCAPEPENRPAVPSGRIIPPPPPGWAGWEDIMGVALAEARLAQKSGEVPVGAVLLSGWGEMLGRAGNGVEALADPTAHAEIRAIRQACASAGNCRLEGAVLVVTLEPCLMCAGAIVHSRLQGVVFGAADKRAGVVTSCLEALDEPFLNHRVWHMGGIREAECAALLRDFFLVRRL